MNAIYEDIYLYQRKRLIYAMVRERLSLVLWTYVHGILGIFCVGN